MRGKHNTMKSRTADGFPRSIIGTGLAALLASLACQTSAAGPLRDQIAQHRAAESANAIDQDEGNARSPAPLPASVQIVRDVPYGSDARQRFDVYLPEHPKDAPVIFMVHGGAWRYGYKSAHTVVDNKVARWVAKGFVFISTDYRLLPEADPIEQARDVARALSSAQDQAASWGADRSKFILMGHSAGAHLVALLATDIALTPNTEITPWLGIVELDSAAIDVVSIMQGRHMGLYDAAFGRDPRYWKAASPLSAMTSATRPIFAVCSTRRVESCRHAHRAAGKAKTLGVQFTVLEKDFSHREINQRLGEDARYTAEVESFMARLDPVVASKLTGG